MMKKEFLFIALMLFMNKTCYAESFIINDQVMHFTKDAKTQILYHCPKECLSKVTKRPKPAKLAHTPIFASSEGSRFCQSLKGQSVIGKSLSGDGRDFCYFAKEEAIFEMDGLSRYISE
jgi:hypothetical protein